MRSRANADRNKIALYAFCDINNAHNNANSLYYASHATIRLFFARATSSENNVVPVLRVAPH